VDEPPTIEPSPSEDPQVDALRSVPSTASEQALVTLGWPYVAVPGALLGWPHLHPSAGKLHPSAAGHPLARRVISCFGLMLGGSAGLFVGGLGAALLVALLHPFVPHFAKLLLVSLTLFSVSFGAVVGRRVLERETFE
jgi:hypothetical protein